MPGVHDLGGLPAGRINREEHTLSFFEKRVDAVFRLLTDPRKPYFTVDALRRAVESLQPDAYFGMAYYERWIEALRMLLIEAGVLSEAELAARMDVVRARVGLDEGRPAPADAP